MQARVPLLPGRSSRCSPRNAALCPPGRTEHVVGVSTAQPFPAACFLEKEGQQSPQRTQGDGGFSWGPPCPQQVDRLSFSKPGSDGQGSRAGLGVCPRSSGCSRQTGRVRGPGRAHQAPWRQVDPAVDTLLTRAAASRLPLSSRGALSSRSAGVNDAPLGTTEPHQGCRRLLVVSGNQLISGSSRKEDGLYGCSLYNTGNIAYIL